MANPRTESPYSAAVDANQNPSTTIVSGTAGTADTTGTAEVIRWSGNPTTGAGYVEVVGGVSVTGGSNVNVVTGTQQTLGTVGTVNGIGTVTNIGSLTNIGALPQVSVGTLSGLPTGTITTGSLTDIAKLYSGTINTGTVTLSGGTLNLGTIDNAELPVAGTLNDSDSADVVTTKIGGLPLLFGGIGNVERHRSVTNVMNNLSTGIAASGMVAQVDNSSITAVSEDQFGVVRMGTRRELFVQIRDAAQNERGVNVTSSNELLVAVNSGTTQISKVPIQIGTPVHILGTAGAATWGTIVAASGAGTKQYVSRVSISGVSGTVDVVVTNIGIGGSTGAGVLERMTVTPQSGITNNYDPVIPSGTNGTISYWLGGAGTANITVNYWQGI